jgi:DNA mismatch repair ATPase MutS
MAFKIDKQTLSDIELFSPNEKSPSIFGFYNRTSTIGGQELLYKIIRTPFTNQEFLENRKGEILFFYNLDDSLKLNKRQVDYVEYYLKTRRIPLKNNFIDATRDRLSNKLKSDGDYYTIGEGIIHLAVLLRDLQAFIELHIGKSPPETLARSFEIALELISVKAIAEFLENIPTDSKKLKPKQINQLDNFFRDKNKQDIRKLLDIVYEIDVLQSLSKLLEEQYFSLPDYSEPENPVFEAIDCVHPLLENPRPNSIKLDRKKSLCFITGPNMSGKSTFLKTVAILTYFAHLGIPVPARSLKIPLQNGLFTTINLSDSLSQGFSHFYTEVNRVKEMAINIKENGKMVIVLDELFRGTNVKDAFDGTLMVVNSLSKIKGAFFFISTHILEVAEHLAVSEDITFKCFESVLNQNKPIYDYKLKDGVTEERVGMQIINSEKIEQILSEIIKKQN